MRGQRRDFEKLGHFHGTSADCLLKIENFNSIHSIQLAVNRITARLNRLRRRGRDNLDLVISIYVRVQFTKHPSTVRQRRTHINVSAFTLYTRRLPENNNRKIAVFCTQIMPWAVGVVFCPAPPPTVRPFACPPAHAPLYHSWCGKATEKYSGMHLIR